jgi:Zn-dependent protease with chaperone function
MTSVCVTDGLLRRLGRRELAGVLAHEVSHIRARDLRLLAVTDVARRLSIFVAGLGAVVIVFGLPVSGAAVAAAPLATLAALMVAPALIALMQLALTRTRELDADLSAVALTGDPDGLASALTKLDADAAGLPWVGPWGSAPGPAPAPAPGSSATTEPRAATCASASPIRAHWPDRRLRRPRNAAAMRCGSLAGGLLRTHPTTAERVRRIRQLVPPAP